MNTSPTFYRLFSIQVGLRVAVLVLVCIGASVLATHYPNQDKLIWLTAIAGSVLLAHRLYLYVNDTNRRLARFFESVQYHDFAVQFTSGRDKGPAFAALNRQLNAVLEAFRQARAEKESNLIFLNAVVQHLSTGVIAFNARQEIVLINGAAYQLLGLGRLTHWENIKENHFDLWQFASQLSGRAKMLYYPSESLQNTAATADLSLKNQQATLNVQANVLYLQGQRIVLLTLQNIHDELQRQQLDAWRNLTRVLRHEMMNSLTPIVTLADTMKDIMRHDLLPGSNTADLEEAIDVIAGRSKNLMDFVSAYRHFSAPPTPRFAEVSLKTLIEQTLALAAPDLKKEGIDWKIVDIPPDLMVRADAGQIEMILLNLFKNAKEAILSQPQPYAGRIEVALGEQSKGRIVVDVKDNGVGIPADLLNEIFIPFFTTKTTGAGVGLSVSLQIMHQHGGDLRVRSEVGKGAVFSLLF